MGKQSSVLDAHFTLEKAKKGSRVCNIGENKKSTRLPFLEVALLFPQGVHGAPLEPIQHQVQHVLIPRLVHLSRAECGPDTGVGGLSF